MNTISPGDYIIINNLHMIDLRKVDKEEIDQAKDILKKMNFDNNFKMRIA